MRRLAIILIGLTALATACGGASPGTTPPVTTPAGTSPAATSTTSAAIPETTSAGGETAPDFSTTLGDGSSFTLSAAAKPVYLVFWAEW